MTTNDIARRNRRNAQGSTGPKSAKGKAIVAGNALRHSATARPDPKSVATWLSIILDKSILSPEDLVPTDDHGVRALLLAEAEVRLVAADRALSAFERGEAEPDQATRELGDMADLIADDLSQGLASSRQVRSGIALLRRIARFESEDTRPGGRRHRLLKRYLREARAQRGRALQAFLDIIANDKRGRYRCLKHRITETKPDATKS
ncbi:hypothetical protein [Ovoidimarina sediminis]|uniref:hypothetical protein n=1 Tax=Ovoidimarina sediminis TaxID=3079856 RepID=UPI002911EBD3|nr:hypothetical protein [Rhodophyticola sp. MJ-SS7]MDU8943252.1 hypothetical protein [Rhodophyticola sp. MJ-SS7]